MKPLILLLAAAATVGAAPAHRARQASVPEPRYEAGGFEPTWSLVIEHGRLTYDPGFGGEGRISMPVPRRQPVRNGYRYETRELRIDVRHVRCQSYPGRLFADTVTVSGVAEPGCGGRPVAPPSLNATIWSIGAIGGTRYNDGESNLLFAYDNVLRGSAGCLQFSVPYHERRPLVRFGRMTVTHQDCAGLALERARRLLETFSGTARISFVDGDTLVLTGPHGAARLIPDG